MSYTNDVKPLNVDQTSWATLLTTWAEELRTWAFLGSAQDYTNDSI